MVAVGGAGFFGGRPHSADGKTAVLGIASSGLDGGHGSAAFDMATSYEGILG